MCENNDTSDRPITNAQLTTAVKALETVIFRNLARRYNAGVIMDKQYQPISLFGADYVIKPYEPEAGKFQLITGLGNRVDIDAGDYFTFHNDSGTTLRLSFWDNKQMTDATKAEGYFQLPLVDGKIPALVLVGGQTGAATTTVSDQSNAIYQFWINIEKEKVGWTDPADRWELARGGGNGADMGINNP